METTRFIVKNKAVKNFPQTPTTPEKVAGVWEKARTPTQKKSRFCGEDPPADASWQNLDRSKKRSAEVDVENRRSFSLALMALFDIGHADAFDLITVDEDRHSCWASGPDGPRGIMQRTHRAWVQATKKRTVVTTDGTRTSFRAQNIRSIGLFPQASPHADHDALVPDHDLTLDLTMTPSPS
ncbi:hypothetical protein GWK47_036496 [Chionoecetes opilio]|uniref:Uncharacterized protein n=1 Tax=Chionoecetes opilio TaxID=41210 RepID=A0A8J5CZN7_CHIOP|nr:hypothetical protein GWK47_036496 [Chionoecetes opilio]